MTISVRWTISGAVYDSASVSSDQVNAAPAAQQTLAFGVPPESGGDGPLPPWAYALLALSMGFIVRRRLGSLPAPVDGGRDIVFLKDTDICMLDVSVCKETLT